MRAHKIELEEWSFKYVLTIILSPSSRATPHLLNLVDGHEICLILLVPDITSDCNRIWSPFCPLSETIGAGIIITGGI